MPIEVGAAEHIAEAHMQGAAGQGEDFRAGTHHALLDPTLAPGTGVVIARETLYQMALQIVGRNWPPIGTNRQMLMTEAAERILKLLQRGPASYEVRGL